MPIPLIIAGVAAFFGTGVGLSAQSDAKETNERAQRIASEAKDLYDCSKHSLEIAQEKTEKSLLEFGNHKKYVLETSVEQFWKNYGDLKEFPVAPGEIPFSEQDALQLREMSDVYLSACSGGAAGAATGAVIALAASGYLPVVTGVLSVAGTAFVAGEVGAAVELVGSALSLGAAVTPLAAIAAPAIFVSGISASIKADENLEKAQTMRAEAEAAAEQMKTSESLCAAIADRADMFDELLLKLNGLFSNCLAMFEHVPKSTRESLARKQKDAIAKKISLALTEDEETLMKLVAVTRSLADAVGSVLATPILTEEGAVSEKSKEIYEEKIKALPDLTKGVDQVMASNCSANYFAEPAAVATAQRSKQSGKVKKPGTVLSAARNVIALIAGLFMAPFMQGMVADTFAVGLLAFAITTILIMNNDAESWFFKLVKNVCCLSIAAGVCILFYNSCQSIVSMSHYIIGSIIVGVVSMIIFIACSPSDGVKVGNFKRTMVRISGCIFFFAIAILVYALLYKLIGISHPISAIITTVAYALIAIAAAYCGD